jgi:GT2 family glycosyltransferase
MPGANQLEAMIAVVVPIKNKRALLEPCLASLLAACDRDPASRLVLVDNGSTDGALELQRSLEQRAVLVESSATTVGGVRNDGARSAGDAALLVFIDSDCVVPAEFLGQVRRALARHPGDAVGCEVVSPDTGHWTERAWDSLHRPTGDRERSYLNSACFCLSAETFWSIGGFDEQKVSSEDVDICERLRLRGRRIWQYESLRILHLGNPQSIAGLYRRLRWHGQGVWERGKPMQLSRMTIATLLHGVVLVFGPPAIVLAFRHSPWLAVSIWLLSLGLMPTAFWLARRVQFGRPIALLPSVALMSITFAARLHGLIDSRRRRLPTT